MSASKEDVAEFVESTAPDNPLCRFQSAPGEAFAAARGVAERDGIGGGVKADLVRARVCARPIGANADGAIESGGFHLLDELDECTRWGVFLGDVVNFPGPSAVFFFIFQEPGSLGDQAVEDVHAHREVGAPDERGVVRLDDGLGFGDMVEPSGGADDERYAGGGDFADVFEDGRWRGELYRDVGVGERFVATDVDAGRDREVVFRGELVDEAAHFAVTDDG